MNILLTHTHEPSAKRWHDELQRLLPTASIALWPIAHRTDGADGASTERPAPNWAHFAIGWQPSAELFQEQSQLKAFFSAAAGVDHLLNNPALPNHLPLYRLEDAGMGMQMAEYCLLEVGRQFHRRDDYAAQQTQAKWGVLKSEKRSDFTVGIFGAGVLAKQIVAGLSYFGYRCKTFSRSSTEPIETFLKTCRVLILCAPLTPETKDYFNHARLSALPQGAYLINVARGALIVDNDLLALLDSAHLSGASLDVFRTEPLPTEHRFWSHPNIRMTPHVSALTLIGPSAKQVAEKIQAFARNEVISGLVDRQRAY